MIEVNIIEKCRALDIDPDLPKSEQVWGVYSEDGKRLLGRYPSLEKAKKHSNDIEANKEEAQMKKKSFQFEVKNFHVDDKEINGVPVKVFEGYASVFSSVDRVRDVVMPGAFTNALQKNGNRMILMSNHRMNVGVADVKEDSKGLFVKGYINQETQAGREGYSLLKMGAVNRMSFGYEVKEQQWVEKDGKEYNELRELVPHEVSFVDFPCNSQAEITAVKSVSDEPTTDPEILKSLRSINQGLIKSTNYLKGESNE